MLMNDGRCEIEAHVSVEVSPCTPLPRRRVHHGARRGVEKITGSEMTRVMNDVDDPRQRPVPARPDQRCRRRERQPAAGHIVEDVRLADLVQPGPPVADSKRERSPTPLHMDAEMGDPRAWLP